jgi:proton glutamate symport protein
VTTTPRRFTATLGFWSLVALVAGLVLGIYGFETGSRGVAGLARAVQPLGVLWLNALQMAVVPLVVMQLLTAISGNGNGTSVGSTGKRTVALIVIMLSTLAVAGYFVAAPLVRLYSVSPEIVDAIRESVLIPSSALEAAGRAPPTLGEWVQGLVPSNALEALVRGDLIQILFVTVILGLAVNRLPEELRRPLAKVFRALSEAFLIVIRWILVATPVGVFALIIGLALGTGTGAVGLLGTYVLMANGVLLFFVFALYPVTAFLGKVSIAAFAKAAAAPQLIGLSTRSSLASMPAQIESGQRHLGFGATTSGFTVPLCVTALKIQTAFGNQLRLLFLAHIFGVTIGPAQFLTFSITILLISFTSLGIPNGGAAFRPLPAYLAVGIPVEGLVILQAVKDINDYGATMANTTGQMAAATILSRGDREPKRQVSQTPQVAPAPAES